MVTNHLAEGGQERVLQGAHTALRASVQSRALTSRQQYNTRGL